MRRRCAQLLFCAFGLEAAPAIAQALADPTQPPAALTVTPDAGLARPAAAAAPQLQSILISTRQGGRQVAVIDGETVRVGEKFGNAVLIKMTQTTVVLRRGTQLHTLTLYPMPSPAPAAVRSVNAQQ